MDGGQAAGERFGRATEAMMPQTRVARMHLLRHGAVRDLERRVVRGQLDTGLSEEGERQQSALVDWFAACEGPIDRIVSSDLPRCRSMALALGARTGIQPGFRESLREQSMGAWQGRTWEEISAEDCPRVTAYWDDYAGTRPPGGESLRDLADRVGAWWDAEREQLLDSRTAVVTHVGVIRVLLATLLGSPLDQCLRFAPATGSHTRLLWSEPGCVLESLGERPWLEPRP
ncbi:histidine phosphatase family protein [Engelhardtia mirabilis]|uniref:histidine phosphatase family protein n=1 Tax=Engelhardtia mirabilis TaxID=2528011 RepID=UPI0011A7A549